MDTMLLFLTDCFSEDHHIDVCDATVVSPLEHLGCSMGRRDANVALNCGGEGVGKRHLGEKRHEGMTV